MDAISDMDALSDMDEESEKEGICIAGGQEMSLIGLLCTWRASQNHSYIVELILLLSTGEYNFHELGR